MATKSKPALTPLGAYLQLGKVEAASFAKLVGVGTKLIEGLVVGASCPSLPLAYEIERATKGVVPMEAWLGVGAGREEVAKLRGKAG